MGESIRDISGWIYNGMWSYCPEYPGAEISELPHPAFLPDEYPVYLQKFIIGGQTGTYIETKAHVDRSAVPVADVPVSEFFRPLVVIDVGEKDRSQKVTVEDLERTCPDIRQGDAVLLRSGWDEHWDLPDYVEGSPYISRNAALWLINRNIGLLGADFPRFDYPPAMEFPWEEFWDKVGLILAPVTNLGGLSGRCGHLAAFPLKITNACSTPCRAVIFLESAKC